MRSAALDSRIPEKDWEQTPASVKALLAELAGKVEQLNKQYA